MVRAEQRRDHDNELQRDDREHYRIPTLKNDTLEIDIRQLASRKQTASIASLTNGRLNEGVEVTAAVKLVLDAKTTVETEVARPLGVDLALEVECALLVCDVPRGDEQGEANPEEERVYGKECTVVEENAGPADERREHGKRSGNRRDDELWLISNTDYIRMVPHVEVNEKSRNETREGVDGELRKRRQPL